jgi:hypothetical protein
MRNEKTDIYEPLKLVANFVPKGPVSLLFCAISTIKRTLTGGGRVSKTARAEG